MHAKNEKRSNRTLKCLTASSEDKTKWGSKSKNEKRLRTDKTDMSILLWLSKSILLHIETQPTLPQATKIRNTKIISNTGGDFETS